MMQAKRSQRAIYLLLAILLATLLASCASADATPTEIMIVPTSAPEVTELAQVPTLVPAGLPDNPLQLVVVPADMNVSDSQIEALEGAILASSSVTVNVVIAQNYADALSALCATTPETVSVAILDGFTWLAAEARNCGEAILRLTASTDRRAPIDDPVLVLLNDSFGTTELDILPGRVFCRISTNDITTWLLPRLLFRSANIDPATFAGINDYEDTDALLTAIAEGDCAGGAIANSIYRSLQVDDDPRLDDVRIAQTSAGLPYGILVYPAQIPLAARLSLTEGLLRLFVSARVEGAETLRDTAEITEVVNAEATDEATDEASESDSGLNTSTNVLQPFFANRGIGRLAEDDFVPLREFLSSLDIDLQILGQ